MIKLYEQIIGTVTDKIEVNLSVIKSNHASNMQSRQNSQGVSDEELKIGVQQAVRAIANNLMLDQILIDDYVCISNSNFSPTLNIVGTLKNHSGRLQFVILTVLKKNYFWTKVGTHRIDI